MPELDVVVAVGGGGLSEAQLGCGWRAAGGSEGRESSWFMYP